MILHAHTHAEAVNYADCGVFAIANAMAHGNGMCFEQLLYDVNFMRKHLDKSSSDKIFPARQRQVVRHTRRREVVPIFCVCRHPEADNKTIACDQCNEWYHSHCVQVPP